MAERTVPSLWDFIAQRFRNTVKGLNGTELAYRLSPEDYSVSETAWRALGACERWSAVLGGAATSEEALEMSPRSVDLIQAASDRYPPGQFPESMPDDANRILERTDDVLATVAAHLVELGPSERIGQYRTWWGDSYNGNEIVARILWTMGYADGQIHLMLSMYRQST